MAIVMDTFHAEDSTTNTVVTIAEFIKKSSGTPASGIGAAIALGAEDSAGNAEQAIQIQGYLTTVTNTSEQGKFLLRVKNAGSFMDALEITVAANAVTIGSNQLTVTLWNTTATTVNAWGAATTINIGNASGATNLAGTLDVSGTVAFGNNASISTTVAVQCDHLYSITSGTLRGANFNCTLNPGSTSTADNYGLQARTTFATAQTFSGVSGAVNAITTVTAAGTVSRGHGVISQVIKSAGTLTDYRGFYSYTTGSSTTITTAYGVYIDKLSAGTTEYGLYVAALDAATTNYAIYTNAGLVRFGGRLIVADTASPAASSTGTAGMITWDASYIYICTSTDTWKRAALTGGY